MILVFVVKFGRLSNQHQVLYIFELRVLFFLNILCFLSRLPCKSRGSGDARSKHGDEQRHRLIQLAEYVGLATVNDGAMIATVIEVPDAI